MKSEENDLFSGAEQELKHLVFAIARYKTKDKMAEVDDSLQIRGKQWLDIVKNALNAIQKHENGHDESALSRIQKCTQLMNNISAFDGWLNVLPNGDYGAIIGGVFTMLVKVLMLLFLSRNPTENYREPNGLRSFVQKS